MVFCVVFLGLASFSVGFPLLAAMVLALLPCDGCHCVVCSCVDCSCAGFVIRLCVFFMLAVVVLDLMLALVFSLCWYEFCLLVCACCVVGLWRVSVVVGFMPVGFLLLVAMVLALHVLAVPVLSVLVLGVVVLASVSALISFLDVCVSSCCQGVCGVVCGSISVGFPCLLPWCWLSL